MGQILSFRCSQCSYTAEVSGGGDAGFFCTTTTIECLDCSELYDVVTSKVDRRTKGHLWREVEPCCPKSKGHQWREWRYPGNCPRCGEAMKEDENGVVIMWD